FEFSIKNGEIEHIEPVFTPVEPVSITPETNVFVSRLKIGMTCKTQDVDIRYTLDGSEPTIQSTLYRKPFVINNTSIVQARAFRKETKTMPNTMSATHASYVSMATFKKQEMQKAVSIRKNLLENGLTYKYFEGNWKHMFLFMAQMQPKKEGLGENLLDIQHRETEKPFGFVYSGYLNAPANGVYTFYCPEEYLRTDVDAGYELQVYLNNELWTPSNKVHSQGTWSVALEKGYHKLEVRYIDYRGDISKIKVLTKTYEISFDRTGDVKGSDRRNFPDTLIERNFTWDGITPAIQISGPSLEKQSIPATLLYRKVRQIVAGSAVCRK
ncbi:MAG TPA: hypothetical protein DD727_06075, partial [Clostridiales bacterium]|nr:hypothetical protein [Clostridiales bacterium]